MLGGVAVTREVAVVVPVYRNAASLPELVRRLDRCMGTRFPETRWRLRFVDDACPAGGGDAAVALAAAHPAVAVTRLTRNVGQHRAIVAGLVGEPDATVWVCLDGDLQDPPEAVPGLVAELGRSHAGGVFAGRRGSYESSTRRVSGTAHRLLMSGISALPRDAGAFFAMDRRLRDAVVAGVLRDGAPSVVAAAGTSGLPLTSVPVRRDVRLTGSSSWTTGARARQSVTTLSWTLSRTLARTLPRTRLGVAGLAAVVAVLVAVLVALRLHSGSPLWLDEAQTVSIARLPLGELLAALRQDGSPPLYYLLLHGWIVAFGTGDDAVRALSSTFAVASLPVAFAVGRRWGGAPAGWSCLVALAACPFAVRYATETRMYALVVLLVLLGLWAFLRALERPSLPRLAAVAVVAGLLALTHYWTVFLLLVVELGLLAATATATATATTTTRAHGRGPEWGTVARLSLAVPCGALVFVPWIPSLLYQLRHTGTPWSAAPTWRDLGLTATGWVGSGWWSAALGALALALVGVALRERRARALVATGLLGLAAGLIVCRWQGTGYVFRYSAPMLVPVVLAVGLGAGRLRARRRLAALAAVSLLGLAAVTSSGLLARRTQAGDTAALVQAVAAPGDVVVFCPDQLGPAVVRLLPATVDTTTYPGSASGARVDWVDYAARNAAASPAVFAARLAARTTGAVLLVRADGYVTFGTQCADLDRDLAAALGHRSVLQTATGVGETEWLLRYTRNAG